MSATRRLTLLLLAAAALGAPEAGAQDCVGPVPEAEPGTPAWEQRESDNVSCGEQRSRDLATNPVYQAALAQQLAGPSRDQLQDPLRDPLRLGTRFRFEETSFVGDGGAVRPGAIFRPPAGAGAAPYPTVVIVHGGAANQEMYLWASEVLAEAGYMVLTFQIPNTGDSHTEDLRKALDFLFSERFPRRADLDREHVGVAGHSAGGVAVSRVGQEDPRLSAIVSWDRAQSTVLPADLKLRTPALFFVADFNCQRVPVCVPERYATRPDPRGPGNKDEDYRRVAAAGVDTMKISLRAATHLDFSVLPNGVGSRYGAAVTAYYTLAWFDRHLRASAEARRRLVAPRFDDSGDRHQISGGTFDPATGANVPAMLSGLPVRDRLSFHFRSAWSLDAGRVVCEDIRRGGCDGTPPAAAPPSRRCTSRRTVRITLPRLRRGERRVRATASVAGGSPRAVAVRRGAVRISLRGRVESRVRVVVRVTTTRGSRSLARAYRTCVPRR